MINVFVYHFSFSFLTAGKGKCMAKSGDCVVKHPSSFATGMSLVVSNSLHCYL